MARRSDHTRDELKKIILEESWNIIEKQGVAGLTARRIAKNIGYAPGTIYNVFGSMDDLYLNVNSLTLDKLYGLLASPECQSEQKTPVQNMKKMAQLYREFAKENRQHWLMLFTYTLPKNKKPSAWYEEKVARLFEPLENLLEGFYTSQQARKRKMAARVLWASVHGICFLEETGKIPLVSNQENPPDMSGYLIDNFILGVKQALD